MLVGTGAVVTGTAAGETVRYTVVVRGDVNGDGRQTATDYLRTKRAVLKIEALEGVYYEAAACFDGQDGLTAADYLSMKRAILGLACAAGGGCSRSPAQIRRKPARRSAGPAAYRAARFRNRLPAAK